jgi:hypothetical protein
VKGALLAAAVMAIRAITAGPAIPVGAAAGMEPEPTAAAEAATDRAASTSVV